MIRTVIPYIILSIVLTALAQIALKAGMASPVVQRSLAAPRLMTFVDVFLNPMVFLGLVIYFSSAVIWLLVLSKIDVSTAYPFVALGIVLTAILGRVVFGEPFTVVKIIAILLIVSGVAILARG